MTKSGSTPRVSVIVPCFNGQRYVRQAIESIQRQTFNEFEMLVIDDGSRDESAAIVESIAQHDQRVQLVKNGANLGLSKTRNRGLSLARGEYVAWLDCDDVAARRRLQLQIAFLERNREFGLVGSWVAELGPDGKTTGHTWVPNAPADEFGCMMLFRAYCWQSAVMLRRSSIGDQRYDETYGIGEDYEFHARLSDTLRGWNLPEVLCGYRRHDANITKTAVSGPAGPLWRVLRSRLARLGIDPSSDELTVHASLSDVATRGDVPLVAAEEWLLKLLRTNRLVQCYPERPFARVLVKQWLYACWSAPMSRSKRGVRFFGSRLLRESGLGAAALLTIFPETYRRLGVRPPGDLG